MKRIRPMLLTATTSLCICFCAVGCGGPTIAQQHVDAKQALVALQQGNFDTAEKEARAVVDRDRRNAYGRVVRAITQYKKTMHQLSTDARTVLIGGVQAGGFNHRYMRSALTQAEEELARVEEDLAAAAHPDLALEICLACWEVDWNHNGRVDHRDRLLFQIEVDEKGNQIPEDDPRRKPTFRFDHGDVLWARAFVSFQRAALDILLAYKWTELDRLFELVRGKKPTITIRIAHPERIADARQRILEGLSFADGARRAYLAETDDDREWVPNPRQKNHPLPLPVDEALYKTWAEIVGDLERLARGEEGLSVEEVAQLGDHRWENPPKGYVNIGKMLSQPKDIVIHLGDVTRLMRDKDVEGTLASVLGDYYVKQMKPSPITRRFDRMKKEIQRGEESLERKLRYLFWLN